MVVHVARRGARRGGRSGNDECDREGKWRVCGVWVRVRESERDGVCPCLCFSPPFLLLLTVTIPASGDAPSTFPEDRYGVRVSAPPYDVILDEF